MLDWPGKVSATIFLGGCSFACPYCHNAGLRGLDGCEPESWRSLVQHLRDKRPWLDGVVVTGGEPTEDPDLLSLLAALAEQAIPVKLDTNGSNPRVLAHAIAEDLVSYVAMDVKTTWERYDEVTKVPGMVSRVAESAGILIASEVRHEFRTTLFPGVVALSDVPRIAEDLRDGELLALQQFRPAHTLDPRASSVSPYSPDEIQATVRRCNDYLRTTARGL